LFDIAPQTDLFGATQLRAIFRPPRPIGHQKCKDHAGLLTAPAAVGSRQEFENLENLGFGSCSNARLYSASVFPGLVDLLSEPLQDPVRFFLVFKGIDGNVPGMHCNELSMHFERDGWRGFRIGLPSQCGIEIRQDPAYIPDEMRDAVQGAEICITASLFNSYKAELYKLSFVAFTFLSF
jgi:hypothetical protein